MKFKKKIVALFLGFAIGISVIVSVSYTYIYTKNSLKEQKSTLLYLANMNCKQLENLILQMESVYEYLLSDMEFLEAAKTLSEGDYGINSRLARYSTEGYTVQKKLNIVYIYQFYRVVFFNKNQANFNNTFPRDDFKSEKSLDEIQWIENVENCVGKGKLIPRHEDDWGVKNPKQVISFVRKIIGNDRGYIEVQMDQEHLDNWFMDNSGKSYLFITSNGNLIYSSDEQYSTQYYRNLALKNTGKTGVFQKENSKKKICMAVMSDNEDGIVAVIDDNTEIWNTIKSIMPFSILILIVGGLGSIIYIEISTGLITRPLRILREYLENINLDNMNLPLEKNISNDEINEVYLALRNMTGRLETTIAEKQRMELLQIQTQMDLLQSQINPHFINNVLNAISNQAVIRDDFEICAMCASLSKMLRYSTNTKEKITTFQREYEYVKQYIYLMKIRYEHRLEVEISLDENLKNVKIPKIVMHQFVENAIQHGYEDNTEVMKISIFSKYCDNGWYLTITDNGCGIKTEVLEDIKKKIENIRTKLENVSDSVALEIGGMGIVNTYARLYIYYGDHLVFYIKNLEHGVQVYIGYLVLIGEEKEDV